MAEKHVHKYRRFLIGDNDHIIFRCMIPGCSHFLPTKELAIGALSQCWGECGEVVELNYLHTNPKHSAAKPLCEACKDIKRKRRQAFAS